MRRPGLFLPCALVGLSALGGCGGEPAEVAAPPVETVIVTPTPTPTPSPPTVESASATASAAAVRIATTGCGSSQGSGSGFLVTSELVGTVAHVVENSRTLSLRNSTGVVSGEVVGLDSERDLALVRIDGALDGTPLRFAPALPAPGETVVSVGYPRGAPLSVKSGIVSGLDRRIEVATDPYSTITLEGMIETSAPTYHGNSGGPIVNLDGEVVGLAESVAATGPVQEAESLAYAVPGTDAQRAFELWASAPVPASGGTCTPTYASLVADASDNPDGPGLAWVMYDYFSALNHARYSDLKRVVTRRLYDDIGGVDTYVAAGGGTQYEDVVVRDVSFLDATTDTAIVSYRIWQDLDDTGEYVCSDIEREYTVRLDSGSWRIDGEEYISGVRGSCPASDYPEPTPGASDSSDSSIDESAG